MGLANLAARTLRARPLRTALTIAGVALGVAVLSASLTMGAGVDAAIATTVRDVVGSADLRVSAFLDRGLSDATVATIRATAGVAVVAPSIERRTFPEAVPGGPVPVSVTVVGVDPSTYRQLHPLDLVAGSWLARPDEPSAVITQTLAAEDGLGLGSALAIQGADAPTHLRVIGIVAGPGPAASSAGRVVFIPLAIAAQNFGISGVTRVDLGLAPGTTAAAVTASLADRLTVEPYLVASPAALAAGLRASTADFQATAAMVAAIVLFVGAFLIINTLSMTVGERAREVGLLRAAGATRGQVVGFVLSGAAMIGVIGAAVGVLLGGALGAAMAAAARELTGVGPEGGSLDAGSLALAALVGIAITVAAAIEPAARAARISPVEALRARLDLPSVRRGRLGWLAAVFVLVAVVALLAWPPGAGAVGADRALAAYGALLVAALLSPFLLPPLARVVGAPIAAALRLEERLARGSLARDRSRAALTLGSLVIGLAMIVALGWTAEAARDRSTAWLADVVPGDEVVTSIQPIPVGQALQQQLAALPGVASVSPIATFDLAVRGLRVDAAAIVGADYLRDGRLHFTAGDRSAALTALDAGGATILPAAEAARLGLRLGDGLEVPLGSGEHVELRIAGIVARSLPSGDGEAMLVGWGDATRAFGVRGAEVFAVRFASGAGPAARDGLALAARNAGLEPNPLSAIQGAVTDALGRVFGLFDALALIAVLVAALGIVNTLAMGVVERVREIGVLRSIGMTRGQASRMVVVEAAILGLVGVVLGAAAGLAVGAILLAMTGGLGPGIALPWSAIGVAAVLGLAGSVAAAFYPSRLAARISIVGALGFE